MDVVEFAGIMEPGAAAAAQTMATGQEPHSRDRSTSWKDTLATVGGAVSAALIEPPAIPRELGLK